MQCPVTKLISFLEAETDLELKTLDVTDPDCVKIRNNKLFPFLKKHATIKDGTREICLTLTDTVIFITLLI